MPTLWLLKVSDVGERLAAGDPPTDETPVPVRLAVCGLVVALS